MLSFEDVTKLINAGYSVDEVLSLSCAVNNSHMQSQTQTEQETGAFITATPPAPHATTLSDDGGELLEAIKDLTQMLRVGNINSTELPEPVSDEERAKQVVANIINPPRRRV